MRDCHIHGLPVEDKASCPDCVVMLGGLSDVSRMTVPQRIAELRMWYGVLEIDFSDMHERIERLVGRPVWTHELVNRERLEQEIATGTPFLEGGPFAILREKGPRQEIAIVEVPESDVVER